MDGSVGRVIRESEKEIMKVVHNVVCIKNITLNSVELSACGLL